VIDKNGTKLDGWLVRYSTDLGNSWKDLESFSNKEATLYNACAGPKGESPNWVRKNSRANPAEWRDVEVSKDAWSLGPLASDGRQIYMIQYPKIYRPDLIRSFLGIKLVTFLGLNKDRMVISISFITAHVKMGKAISN